MLYFCITAVFVGRSYLDCELLVRDVRQLRAQPRHYYFLRVYCEEQNLKCQVNRLESFDDFVYQAIGLGFFGVEPFVAFHVFMDFGWLLTSVFNHDIFQQFFNT